MKKTPVISIALLALIIAGCLFGDLLSGTDPYYMNFSEVNLAPGKGHLFGTDTLGRDLFAVIWCGGRISLTVGILSTILSTAIAVIYGAAAGLAS